MEQYLQIQNGNGSGVIRMLRTQHQEEQNYL